MADWGYIRYKKSRVTTSSIEAQSDVQMVTALVDLVSNSLDQQPLRDNIAQE
jgi:hypothetical protein